MATRRVSGSQPRTRKANPADGPAALTPAAESVPAAKPRKRRVSASPKGEQALIAATRAPAVTEDERRGMIAYAAYLRAERRGFSPDGQAEDWLAAEKEVDALLNSRHTAAQ